MNPDTMLRLDGKAALVTGATRGIGRAIAEVFGAAGAAVCITARKAGEVDETVASLTAAGVAATGHVGNAGVPGDIDAAVAHCLGTFGAVDIVVNNAATNPVAGPLMSMEPAALEKVWRVNQDGPLRFVRRAYDGWMADHGGVVLNIASVGGLRNGPFIGAYNVSKAALVHMTRQLALELAPGVRVNALAPGLIKTSFSRALYEADEAGAVSRQPMGRLGVPDDVAAAALFLCSEAASWITGDTIVIDGGSSLIWLGG